VKEPLSPAKAKPRIREILRTGTVRYSKHALDEMKNDELTTVDGDNVLGGGWVEPGELVDGTWRYRVRTSRICFVIAFRSEQELVVVTAWRE
jgi:hypothetical protein